MSFGLRLQQDAPVSLSLFETDVLPAINDAFGPSYKAHLLNRMDGGIFFSVRDGQARETDGFHVRFNFRNWGCELTSDTALPHYHGPEPLFTELDDGVHKLAYNSDGTAWSQREIDTVNIALVKVLQWRPLRSRGYKLVLPHFTKFNQ